MAVVEGMNEAREVIENKERSFAEPWKINRLRGERRRQPQRTTSVTDHRRRGHYSFPVHFQGHKTLSQDRPSLTIPTLKLRYFSRFISYVFRLINHPVYILLK